MDEVKEEKIKCKCGQSQDPDGFCDGSHVAQKAEP
jgi:CDGSH-type Zn-finger protein